MTTMGLSPYRNRVDVSTHEQLSLVVDPQALKYAFFHVPTAGSKSFHSLEGTQFMHYLRLLSMVEETVKHPAWKIKVHARANKAHFKFKAERKKPTCQLLKFSIFLKFHEFLLQVKSESEASLPRRKPRALLSKAVRFFKSSGSPQAKKESVAAKKSQDLQKHENKSVVNRLGHFVFEKPICVGSLLVGTLAYLSESIRAKVENGLLIHGPSMLLFLGLLFRKYITGKAWALFVFLAIAAPSCVGTFLLDRYLAFDGGEISELVRKAWKFAAGSGCLFELFQALGIRESKPR